MRIGRDMWDRVGAGSAEFGVLGLEQRDRLKKGWTLSQAWPHPISGAATLYSPMQHQQHYCNEVRCNSEVLHWLHARACNALIPAC